MSIIGRTHSIRVRLAKIIGVAALIAAQHATAAIVDVQVRSNVFIPNDITVEAGDTIRFRNLGGGFHDVVADDGSWGLSQPSNFNWTFTHKFETVGTEFAHCTVHSQAGADISANMNMKITVIAGGPPPPPTFAINQGIAGAWFNPATSGQGILFDIEPNTEFIFGAIFTYETATAAKLGAPEHRWLTVQGNYSGNTAELPIFLTSGGVFDQPVATTTAPIGTATVTFNSCTEGSIAYVINDPPLTGTIPLQRVIAGTEGLCNQIATPAGIE